MANQKENKCLQFPTTGKHEHKQCHKASAQGAQQRQKPGKIIYPFAKTAVCSTGWKASDHVKLTKDE